MTSNPGNLNQMLRTKNACIYSNERRKLSPSLLRSIAGISDVSSNGGFFRHPTYLSMQVSGERLQLNVNRDRENIKQHAAGMHGWVNHIHETSPLMNIEIFHGFIDQINQMYGVIVDSEFSFQSPIWKALLKIAQPIEGVIFIHDSFVDCDGRILFGYLANLSDELNPDGK